MWWSSLLAGNWIDGGEAVIFGEGRAGAVYSWKGRQLREKRLYISPEPNSQFEKSAGMTHQRRVNLWILGVDIKPLIGRGELGHGIVDFVFLDF